MKILQNIWISLFSSTSNLMGASQRIRKDRGNPFEVFKDKRNYSIADCLANVRYNIDIRINRAQPNLARNGLYPA